MSLRGNNSLQRSSTRLSRQGFSPIPDENSAGTKMHQSGDATIDIPMADMQRSSSGAMRRVGSKSNSDTPLAHEPLRQPTAADEERRQMFGGRRIKKINSKGETVRIGTDGELETVNRIGRFYKKVTDFSIITRYIVYIAPLGACFAVPIILGATAFPDAKLAGVPLRWFFVWIEIVWVSLWISKIVMHFLPYVFQFAVGVVSSGTRKYALILKALEIPLSLVGWSVTSLATFVPVMTRNPWNRTHDSTQKKWETVMNQVLGAAVLSTIVLAIEKALIQMISINYHRKQFNFKIKDNKRNVYLLSLLYDASRAMFPMYCNEFSEEDYIISDQLNLAMLGGTKRHGATGHARSGSATPFRFVQDVGRFGDKVTSAFGNVAQEITGKQLFNPNSAHSIVSMALEKKRSSEALAKRIWMAFVIEGKEALYPEDVAEVLGSMHHEEAGEAFVMLDRDMNGDISLEEAIQAIVQVSRDRKSLSTSMHDVDQAINVLDRMLMFVVFIIVIFTFIAFLNSSFLTTLATAGTTLLSLSFVFSATAAEILGSCIFIFVKHPYDVGDRVDITSTQLEVEHISLLFTVFRRIKGTDVGQSVQIPNNILNTLWIENVSRSRMMKEQLTIDVSFDTSFEDIQALKNELLTFVTDKDNTRDFLPDIDVEVLGTSDMSKLQLKIECRHKGNFANEMQRASRRSKFMCALVTALRRVPIYGPGGGGDTAGSASNPTYSVSVDDTFAKEARDASAKTKDEKRLVPRLKPDTTSPVTSRSGEAGGATGALGLSARQEAIITDINSRPAVSDDPIWNSRDDSSTLGGDLSATRQSFDAQGKQDLEDTKNLLHRASTTGKRKPNLDPRRVQTPNVPTISEPTPGASGAVPMRTMSSGQQYLFPTAHTDYALRTTHTNPNPNSNNPVDDYDAYRPQQAPGLATPNLGPGLPTTPSAYQGASGASYMQPYVQDARQLSSSGSSNPYRVQSRDGSSRVMHRRPGTAGEEDEEEEYEDGQHGVSV